MFCADSILTRAVASELVNRFSIHCLGRFVRATDGDQREDQHDSDGAGKYWRIVLPAREREKPRARRGSNNTETRQS